MDERLRQPRSSVRRHAHGAWAKALALEDGAGKRAVLVTLDLVGIDRETSQAVCAAARERLNLDRDQVALCVSHTHTGPVLGRNLETMYFLSPDEWAKVQRYTASLKTNIVRVMEQAVDRLAPAMVSWSSGYETFGVNRRNNPEPLVPATRASGNLKGPADYDVPVLRIADAQDKPLAVVFGYACHATTLSDYQWSGDTSWIPRRGALEKPSWHHCALRGGLRGGYQSYPAPHAGACLGLWRTFGGAGTAP